MDLIDIPTLEVLEFAMYNVRDTGCDGGTMNRINHIIMMNMMENIILDAVGVPALQAMNDYTTYRDLADAIRRPGRKQRNRDE